MKTVKMLLKQIQNGAPCDWPNFRQLIFKQGVTADTLDELFRPKRTASGNYTVEIIDPAGLQSLLDNLGIETDARSRATAAIHGDSHTVPVSGNLVVVQSPAHSQAVVFECDSYGKWTYPTPPANKLVLVENMENFLARDKILSYLEFNCGVILGELPDIAYSAGNAITKNLNLEWLSHYDTIYCFFDIDSGGFRMFESLRRLLSEGETELLFVVPKDLEKLLDSTHHTLSEEDRENLMQYTACTPPINLLANTLLKSGKNLEQEVHINAE